MSRRGRWKPLGRERAREKEGEISSLPSRWKQAEQKIKAVGRWSGPDISPCPLPSLQFYNKHSIPAKQGCPTPPCQSISTRLAASSGTCQLCPGPCLSPWGDTAGGRGQHQSRAQAGAAVKECASILWHGGAVCLRVLGFLPGMPWGGREPALGQTSLGAGLVGRLRSHDKVLIKNSNKGGSSNTHSSERTASLSSWGSYPNLPRMCPSEQRDR